MPWRQTQLNIQFSPESLQELLEEGAQGTLSAYCHDTIMSWALRYADHIKPLSHQSEHQTLWLILDDMVSCWELHIASCYTMRDMKRFSRTDLVLPRHYFSTWLSYLESHDAH